MPDKVETVAEAIVVGSGPVGTQPVPWHGQAQSAVMTVPPLATVLWVLA